MVGNELVSRFQFVADHLHTVEVKWLCAVVEVAQSSFYAERAGAPGRAERAAADEALADRIRAVHDADNTYGAPRITAELNDGVPGTQRVNHKRVARVMRSTGIAGYRCRVRTTTPDPASQKVPDLLKRDFTAEQPNTAYVGDITYLPLVTGANLYLATVIDCCSRRVTGWAIADLMRTELVKDALKATAVLRGTLAGAVFHSDHGSQGGFNRWTRHSAASWRSPSQWAASGPVPTTRSPNRSTRPSNAKSSKTAPAGLAPRPAAARSSDGWPTTTPNDDTPAAARSAPRPSKGASHPLRSRKPRNHNSRVYCTGVRPYRPNVPPADQMKIEKAAARAIRCTSCLVPPSSHMRSAIVDPITAEH